MNKEQKRLLSLLKYYQNLNIEDYMTAEEVEMMNALTKTGKLTGKQYYSIEYASLEKIPQIDDELSREIKAGYNYLIDEALDKKDLEQVRELQKRKEAI